MAHPANAVVRVGHCRQLAQGGDGGALFRGNHTRCSNLGSCRAKVSDELVDLSLGLVGKCFPVTVRSLGPVRRPVRRSLASQRLLCTPARVR